MSTSSQKQPLRDEIRSRLKAMSPQLRANLSGELCVRIRRMPEYISSTHVLLYSFIQAEPDLLPLLSDMERGKQFYFPKVEGEALTVHRYNTAADLRKGAFGIMEPYNVPIPSLEVINLVLVPALGFDETMNRLGRGKGYYDRLLISMPDCLKVGVCFDQQMIAKIPCESFDVRMNAVVTPSRVIREMPY